MSRSQEIHYEQFEQFALSENFEQDLRASGLHSVGRDSKECSGRQQCIGFIENRPLAMQISLALMVCALVAATHAQFFQQLEFERSVQPQVRMMPSGVPHRAVQLNAEAEARLPSQLQNPFYKNPRIVAALAKESWFTPDEQQVLEREADKIPREKIFSILHHAGLARRR